MQDEIPAELYDTSTSRYSEAELFRRGPDGQTRAVFPWRTTFVAIFLFGFGVAFLLLGLLHFKDTDHGLFIAFTAIGCVAFLPGAYVAFNLIQTLRGVPGFHLSQCTCSRTLFSAFSALLSKARRLCEDADVSLPLGIFFVLANLLMGLVAHWDDYRW